MKRLFLFCIIMALVCSSLCACYGKTNAGGGADSGTGANAGGGANDGDGADADAGTGSGTVQDAGGQKQGGSDDSSGSVGLQFLSNRYGESACNTENGYYYLTEEAKELKDGSYGTHLKYMDFASRREIYLCSTAGCRHDTLDCPAVFSDDDFPTVSTLIFVLGDHLYLLSREYDNDGTVVTEFTLPGEEGSPAKAESKPAALYRANLDGTGREKIYTFDAALTLEEQVIGNEKGIYLVTKKLSSEKGGDQTYTTSSERKLVYLDLNSLSLREVCSMDFNDHKSWKIIGCSQNEFLLSAIDFGRELTREEEQDDDAYKELYDHSFMVYAALRPEESGKGGKLKELVRQSNEYVHSVQIVGDSLYVSSSENENIDRVNIKTGERGKFCKLPQNQMMNVLGDTLCCRTWDLTDDPTWYFVNTKTGAVTHTSLVIPCNGWSVDFRGETSKDVLFVYDYDATSQPDGSYEIHQYKHALISKDDLFAGKENYRKIKMIDPGK